MTNKILEQARKIRERTDRDLAAMRSRGAAGDGAVTVEMNGHRHLISLSIRPDVLRADRVADLERWVMEAVNQVTDEMTHRLYARIGKTATDLPRLLS